MHKQIRWLAGVALLLATVGAAQAAVDKPYVADWSFGTKGVVADPLVKFIPQDPPLASGQQVFLSDDNSLNDGSTLVAGVGHLWSMLGSEYRPYLVVVRYGVDGQRLAWTNPSAGYSDDSHMYLYVPPGDLRIKEVRDVRYSIDGGVYVLVDALESASATTTDTIVVVFGPDGQYKGSLEPMTTPGVDDVGAAIIMLSNWMFIASSSGTQVTLTRYTLTYPRTFPVLDTAWGGSGRVSQNLPICHALVGGVKLPLLCNLRAERGLVSRTGSTPIYVAGQYVDSQGGGSAESELFIMHFDPYTGVSDAGYPVTWGFAGIEDGLRGLAFRPKNRTPQRAQDELYVLNSFPLPCGNGFVVVRFNAETGTYLNRTYTNGGGQNADPNVCAQTPSLVANDLALTQNYTAADRYLAVVGTRLSGELYTGTDAFLALVDTTNMHSNVQVQAITHNAGQYPADASFNAVTGKLADGTFTATGRVSNYDGDSSQALTIRMHPDRIFGDDFDG